MLACPESEVHVLPIQFLHLLLRRAGRRVVFLGADVPVAQLESTVHDVKPALVVMAAQQLTTAVHAQRGRGTAADDAACRRPSEDACSTCCPNCATRLPGPISERRSKERPAAIDELLLHPALAGSPDPTGAAPRGTEFP